MFPIKNGNGFTGCLIFSIYVPFNLEAIEVNFLKIFSNNFGGLIANKLNKKLSNDLNLFIHYPSSFYKSVLNTIPACISDLNASQNYIYLSGSAVKNSDLRKWLIGKNDFDYCKCKNKSISIAQNRNALFEKVLKS
jgi:hypothetical protein